MVEANHTTPRHVPGCLLGQECQFPCLLKLWVLVKIESNCWEGDIKISSNYVVQWEH